jgi:hypothetical protein
MRMAIVVIIPAQDILFQLGLAFFHCVLVAIADLGALPLALNKKALTILSPRMLVTSILVRAWASSAVYGSRSRP